MAGRRSWNDRVSQMDQHRNEQQRWRWCKRRHFNVVFCYLHIISQCRQPRRALAVSEICLQQDCCDINHWLFLWLWLVGADGQKIWFHQQKGRISVRLAILPESLCVSERGGGGEMCLFSIRLLFPPSHRWWQQWRERSCSVKRHWIFTSLRVWDSQLAMAHWNVI